MIRFLHVKCGRTQQFRTQTTGGSPMAFTG
jgi:hypothetical protein